MNTQKQLFNSEMVRDIIKGRKTQLRLVIYPQPKEGMNIRKCYFSPNGYAYGNIEDDTCTCQPVKLHMPKWFERINLEIINTRVERLQDITDEDARKEGIRDVCHCEDYNDDHGIHSNHNPTPTPGWASYGYALMWDAINYSRGYPWASNPWVWVIEFKRIES